MSSPVNSAAPSIISSSIQPQINISPDILSELRDHITKVDVLPNDTPTTSTEIDKPSTDSKTNVPFPVPVQDYSEKTGTHQSFSSDKDNSDPYINITRNSRALVVVHKGEEPLTSVPATIAKGEDEFAFAHVKNVEETGEYVFSLIEIYSEDLRKALEEVRAKLRPNYYRDGRNTFPELLFSPFEGIVWIYDELKSLDAKSYGLSTQTSSDLNLLLGYVVRDPSLVKFFETQLKRPSQIAWKNIWTLFPASTDIVARPFLDTPQIFRTQDPLHSDDLSSRDDYYEVKAWCYDHNGRDWLRVCHVFTINKYEGEKPIDELQCYPLSFDKNHESLRRQCIQTGERFAKLFREKVPPRFNYNDHMMIDKRTPMRALFPSASYEYLSRRAFLTDDEEEELVTTKLSQEVIVDPEPWEERYGSLYIGNSRPEYYYDDSAETKMSDNSFVPVPDDDRLIYCPPRFHGCIPKERVIAQFKVAAVDDANRIQKDDSLYCNALQLNQTTKTLLLAQVEQLKYDPAQGTDVIKGKGNNLVVLLHGLPGVGKTLTAETVARAAGKPLLNTTVADVSLDPQKSEAALSRMFSVASRWQAVMLIEEADAFLEERDIYAASERNAFVTVMLRILEYYNGIVMLTTNRLITLDKAVQSRIHLPIRYDKLQAKQCIEIFKTSIKNLKVDTKKQDLEKMIEWLEETAITDQEGAMAVNGREIRNIVTSATALMRHKEDETLTLGHIREVFNSTRSFKKQLEEKMWAWEQLNQGNTKGRGR